MQFKTFSAIISLSVLTVVSILLVLWIHLPDILESRIKILLLQQIKKTVQTPSGRPVSDEDIQVTLESVGFSSAALSGIQILDGISVDLIHMDYQITSLSSIDIQRIILSGVTIQAEKDEYTRIQVQGIRLRRESLATPKPSAKPPGGVQASLLPSFPNEIECKNSRISLQTSEGQILIPFDFTISMQQTDKQKAGEPPGSVELKLSGYPFGSRITADLMIDVIKGFKDVKKGITQVEINGESIDMASVLKPADLKWDSFIPADRFDFKLKSSQPLKKWQVIISPLGIAKPVEMKIREMKADVEFENKKIMATGDFQLSGIKLPFLGFKFNILYNMETRNADIYLKTKDIQQYELNRQHISTVLNHPKISARFRGTPESMNGSIMLKSKQCAVTLQEKKTGMKNLVATSDIEIQLSGKKRAAATFKIDTEDVEINTGPITAHFPTSGISGDFVVHAGQSVKGFMKFQGEKGRVDAPKFNVHARDIDMVLPVYYPKPLNRQHGYFSIPSIVYDKRHTAAVKGRAVQTHAAGFELFGDIALKNLSGLKTVFSSTIDMTPDGITASADLKTKPFNFTSSDMKSLIGDQRQLPEFECRARVNAAASYKDRQLSTSMTFDIQDGHVSIDDQNLTARKINTKIEFDSLSPLLSRPGQIVTIGSIEKDSVKIEDAAIRFTLEKDKSVLLENIKFNWCSGLVTTEALRFPNENEYYAISLFCDHLELTQLLQQIGAFDAQGSGTLNGRLPIVYNKGNIAFDNGFLFSTPGQGGRIMIRNSDRITQGIPMDSPQFSQLDLAREALKNYDYKWTTLQLNTLDDTLFVNMELDGAPEDILPFEYSKKLGRFVRVDGSRPGSRFQGIKLDIKLKLPFNEVLKSGNKLKELF